MRLPDRVNMAITNYSLTDLQTHSSLTQLAKSKYWKLSCQSSDHSNCGKAKLRSKEYIQHTHHYMQSRHAGGARRKRRCGARDLEHPVRRRPLPSQLDGTTRPSSCARKY